MRTLFSKCLFAAAAGLGVPAAAFAIQVCELNGQHVNPANGHTTAGKTGLMRCREGEGGPVVREQGLQAGAFVGIVRYYKNGALEREFSVNERGNKEGLSREFALAPGATTPTVVSEENYRNGSALGLARRWHVNGQLKRASYTSEDRREQASAEFTSQAKLSSLRCAVQPQLAPAVDDALWCGHGGEPHTVTLYTEKGLSSGNLTHERGQLRKRESLWSNGQPREQMESDERAGTERSFYETGIKRRERQWVSVPTDGKSVRSTTLDREYHESGTLVREQRWKPAERGSELQSDLRWYLNGQLKQKLEYLREPAGLVEKETGYRDNGTVFFEGSWILASRYGRRATGVHKNHDDEGRVRVERNHDDRGRVSREREFDEAGKSIRDDELFEDGSRKAFTPR